MMLSLRKWMALAGLLVLVMAAEGCASRNNEGVKVKKKPKPSPASGDVEPKYGNDDPLDEPSSSDPGSGGSLPPGGGSSAPPGSGGGGSGGNGGGGNGGGGSGNPSPGGTNPPPVGPGASDPNAAPPGGNGNGGRGGSSNLRIRVEIDGNSAASREMSWDGVSDGDATNIWNVTNKPIQ